MTEQYQPVRLNERQWFQIFPEAHEIIPLKIRELEEKNTPLLEKLEQELEKIKDYDEFSRWFFRQWLKLTLVPEIVEINRHILRLSSALKKPDKKTQRWQQMVESAKNASILETVSCYIHNLQKRGSKYVALCPFHQEKTPSFTIFPNTNHFYCFGCLSGGDGLTFVQRIDQCSFVDAVKKISIQNNMYAYSNPQR